MDSGEPEVQLLTVLMLERQTRRPPLVHTAGQETRLALR